MIFGTCKLHTTRSGEMQILSKFCHNKHLTRDCRSAPRHARHLLHYVMVGDDCDQRIHRQAIQHHFCDESVKALSHQALVGNSFRERRELQFFCTRNAFITILSSRVILPITMHKCVVIQQCYFYFLTGSYSQKNYYKLEG